MAYKKIGFKDRIDNKPTTYLVDGKSTEIIKDDTDVEEEGTNLNATNLNHMEDGILQNSRDIEILNKQIINIKVPVESVNGKTGDVELKAQDIKSKSGTTLEDFKSNTEEEIKNLKSSVDNGKSSLYSAIVDKKVTPRSKDFDDLAKGIREIKLGQGNAQPNDVLEGKTFTNAEGNLLTGNMKNYGAKIITPTTKVQTLNKGYYDSIKVNPIDKNVLQDNFPELKPENIVGGVNIAGIVGQGTKVEFRETVVLDGEKEYISIPYPKYIFVGDGTILSGILSTNDKPIKNIADLKRYVPSQSGAVINYTYQYNNDIADLFVVNTGSRPCRVKIIEIY